MRPTKVTKEDLELAEELSRVTSIKELVTTFITEMEDEFTALQTVSEAANPVATYKAVIHMREELLDAAHFLQAQLLTVLGEIDGADAMELSDPDKQEIAGTMDAALEEPATKLDEEN